MHALSDAVCVTHSLSVRCVTPSPHSFSSRREVHITSALGMHFWLPSRHLTFLILLKPSTPIIGFSVCFIASTLLDLAKTVDFHFRVLLWMSSGVDYGHFKKRFPVISQLGSARAGRWSSLRPNGWNQLVFRCQMKHSGRVCSFNPTNQNIKDT